MVRCNLDICCAINADVSRMSKVCVEWSLEDLCEMEEEDMDRLLRSYAPEKVPSFEQVRLREQPGDWRFDGSFGWACVV